MSADRKPKVLHTRVPERLDSELREKAERLGLSVSTLVRNILSNTVGLVEDIVIDSTNIARSAVSETPPTKRQDSEGGAVRATPPPSEPVTFGWQAAVLNLNAICIECNGILPKGTHGAIGITDQPGNRPFICLTCLDSLTKGPSHADDNRNSRPEAAPTESAASESGASESEPAKSRGGKGNG